MLVADLHLHSSYSRATARDITVQRLAETAKRKGIQLLGTGDFTHPEWFRHLKENLSEAGEGVYEYDGINFILQVELSLIYSQGGRSRRIHNLVFAPDFETAEQVNAWLSTKGRMDYDGRPIFGFSSAELVENLMSISRDIVVIPAHVWTPWYSLFGSMSGFDSVEECFGDQSRHIFALETGLSSDPPMNWRVSALDKHGLVSFSDAHSPAKLGRECSVFDIEKVSYSSLFSAIKKRETAYTVEVPPHFGKYHYDGHRNCGVSMAPKQALLRKNICPVCMKQLTIGVEHRVQDLADRDEGFVPEGSVPFKTLIPLDELLASVHGTTAYSKKIQLMSNLLVEKFGSELAVLLDASHEEIARTDEKAADAIMKNRSGKIAVVAGYDGVYGKPLMNEEVAEQKIPLQAQKNLGQFFGK